LQWGVAANHLGAVVVQPGFKAGSSAGDLAGLRGTSGASRFRMEFILWIIAVILVIGGIFAIIRRQLLWGIVLIVVGCLVGPGGVSLFT